MEEDWKPIYIYLSMKRKCLTLHVFACIYKLMYAYVYTYNHTYMFLGCSWRGPRPWQGLGSLRAL